MTIKGQRYIIVDISDTGEAVHYGTWTTYHHALRWGIFHLVGARWKVTTLHLVN